MAQIFDIHVVKDEITPLLKRIQKNAPMTMEAMARDVTQDATRRLRMEVLRQHLIWRGTLLHGIKSEPITRFHWAVKVPMHGVALDSMEPHWVSLKRGRNITEWARTAQNSPWKGYAPRGLPRAIRVNPHPWINRPLGYSRRQIPVIIKRHLGRLAK
jgi:hypothetical protein